MGEGGLMEVDNLIHVNKLILNRDKQKISKLTTWVNEIFKLSVLEKEKRYIFPKRGEIWAVDLGENIGSEVNKVRPCLIVQNNKGNKNGNTIIVVPISSRPVTQPSQLKIGSADLLDEDNITTGTLLGEQVRVVSKARLLAKFTKIKPEKMVEVDKMLSVALGMKSHY